MAKNEQNHRFTFVFAVAFLGVLGLSSVPAHAQLTEWVVTGTVPAGLTPNDLHLLITGTGGTITNPTVVPAGTANTPNGNNINIVWPTNLAAGTAITITFRTAQPFPINVNTWTWTKNGSQIGTPNQGSFQSRPIPPWYNPATRRGFPPDISDFFQHQRDKPTAACPALSPPGQCDPAWENGGGWCNRATYANACYRLYKEGSQWMFGPLPPAAPPTVFIENNNWLSIVNGYIPTIAGGMSGTEKKWQDWLDARDNPAPNQRRLKYDYVVYFPDVWFNPTTPPDPPLPTPAPPAAGGWHYLGFGVAGARVWKPVPGTPYDKMVTEFKGGATVMLVLRTFPWVPAFQYTDPPTNHNIIFTDPTFNGLWWQGNGGNTNITAPYPPGPGWPAAPRTFKPSWGAFHSVIVAGLDESQRKVYIADPDSNKGNFAAQAGFDRDALQVRKYHPWINPPALPQPAIPNPETQGDGIPVPPRGANLGDDPMFFDPYYIGLTIDDNTVAQPEFRGRRVSPGNAANERYRNVVINMLEIVATAEFRKKVPVGPPLKGKRGTPTSLHEFEATAGPVNRTDEIWFLPVTGVLSVDPPTGALANWQIVPVGPTDPIAIDPYGNNIETRGFKIYRAAEPPLAPGQIGDVRFMTQRPWDEREYEVFIRDADDPTSYRVQSYGIVEPGFGDQERSDIVETQGPPADFNGDHHLNVDDLLILIGNWGQFGVLGDFHGDGVNVDDLLLLLNNWGPTP